MPVEAVPDKTPDRIARMFDAIAPRYDLLNHVLSVGIDRRWRARAIRSLGLTGREVLLDVCTGTADVALQAVGENGRGGGPFRLRQGFGEAHQSAEGTTGARPSRRPSGAARVLGVDFAGAMLSVGRRKVMAAGEADRIALVRGDATNLPVPDASVDAATVAFGIRNVERPELACLEMARAMRSGGRLAILEFGVPRIPGISALYLWYFKHLLPRVGRMVSGHSAAYSYLPASVGSFPPPSAFMAMLGRAGFTDIRADPLTFGIVYLYTGVRR